MLRFSSGKASDGNLLPYPNRACHGFHRRHSQDPILKWCCHMFAVLGSGVENAAVCQVSSHSPL